VEIHSDFSAARRREAQIKKWSRARKEAFVADDLSRLRAFGRSRDESFDASRRKVTLVFCDWPPAMSKRSASNGLRRKLSRGITPSLTLQNRAGAFQLSNKEGSMRTNKQLVVCLTVCLVLSFVAAVNAAPPEIRGVPVTILNTNSKPIAVTEVNKYQVQKEIVTEFLPVIWITRGTLYTVPVNKRLVIEYFSCSNGNAGTYGTSYSCSILTSVANEWVEHWLPTTPYGHPEVHGGIDSETITNPPAFISAGQKVQIYADPGKEVIVSVFRSKNTPHGTSWSNGWIYNYDEYMSFSFSGYLVDAAPQ